MNPQTKLRSDPPVETIRLSMRETDVLQMIGSGISSQDAARSLFLSKRTIDFHLSNIYEKLNVNNRLQAYHRAQGLGLLGERSRMLLF